MKTRSTAAAVIFPAAVFLFGLVFASQAQDGEATPADPARLDTAHNTQPMAWNDLGDKATAQYSGDGLAVKATDKGARLRCVFQKLEGEVTPEGLRLSSTIAGSSNTPFGVSAATVGREYGLRRTLPSTGTVETSGGLARFIRQELIEEYSVSVDGLRQDFVLPERLPGGGALRVALALSGATAEASPDGARLVLQGSGRKLNYHRLRATDATGRELAAWMEVSNKSEIRNPKSEIGLAVMVEDGGAKYPVRIDPTFSDANWSSMGGIPGVHGAMAAAAVDQSGNLYVACGNGVAAGDIVAHGIVKWEGSRWSNLGSGINGLVWALAVSGSDLYAGGDFTTAGGVAANNIAKWNGSSWSALDSGIRSDDFAAVYALAISGNNLYVGGLFTQAGGIAATNIAKWNGNSWSALGSGISAPPDAPYFGGAVSALAASGTNLYAGGHFTTSGDIAATNIAKWNGIGWSALGSAFGGVLTHESVRALAVSGTNLYAGGWFMKAGGVAATNIARWDGNSWSALGSGMNYAFGGSVEELAVLGTDLYAGGQFTTAGGIAATGIAKWNGSNWSTLGSGMVGSVNALAVSGTNLYVGGTPAGDTPAKGIARWDGSKWSALGSGMDEPVRALAMLGTNLYVGGKFTIVGRSNANLIARWDGSGWSALGSGISGPPSQNYHPYYYERSVNALAVSGSDLYAGGSFTNAGGMAASNIARWNGSNWSTLASGINGPVYALAVSGSNLYVGGDFWGAGGLGAGAIAKWDGSSWSTLGSGLFVLVDDGEGGYYFEVGSVKALAVSGTNLYAGGYFTTSGGIALTNIAKWDGNSWSALGSSYPSVAALAVSGTDLYAGGPGGITKWNGSTWEALGSGVRGPVFCALAVSGSDLYAGGDFTIAGDKVSAYIARARIGSAAKAIAASSGVAVVHFSGVTGYEYDVQRTASLNPPITWATVTTSPLSPAADGSFTFTDTNAPTGAAYYRAVQR